MKNNKLIRLVGLALVVCLGVLLYSCKSSRTLDNGKLVQKLNKDIVRDALDAEVEYKTISGRVGLQMLVGGKEVGVKLNGQLKIVRNEGVQLSVRVPFLGSEVLKISITQDSIYLIDRGNRLYSIESIEDLKAERGVDLDYKNLESLFSNTLFLPGKKEVKKDDSKQYKIELDAGKHVLTTFDKSGMTYQFGLGTTDRIESVKVETPDKIYSIDWLYKDFNIDNKILFPRTMEATALIKKRQISLIITNSGLDFDKEISIEGKTPNSNKYTQASIVEILKKYIK